LERKAIHNRRFLYNFLQFTLGFAGYEIREAIPDSGDGVKEKIVKIGDQGNLEFTQVMKDSNQEINSMYSLLQFCQRLGWKGKGTQYDILPLVLSDDGQPRFYEIPEELVIRVRITHPK